MDAFVVYESMYGNTCRIAEAIADGLGVDAVSLSGATFARLRDARLVVVGAPTHVWGMSSTRSRRSAVAAARPGSGLTLEPDAAGSGIRDWLAVHAPDLPAAVAFDTRRKLPALLTGRASRGIAKRLRRQHVPQLTGPKSFFVDRHNRLLPGELVRAGRWGADLAKITADL